MQVTSQLFIVMAERIGLLVGVAFLATRLHIFRRQVDGGAGPWERAALGLVFGLFGILGTFVGIVVSPEGLVWGTIVEGRLGPADAIANSRAVSAIIAGLVGGPWVGLTAGLIAGLHRLSLGGFTAVACAIATTLQGLLAGMYLKRLAPVGTLRLSNWAILVVAVLMEAMQMGIILLVARPFSAALGLVQLIGLPMIVANSVGVVLFLLVVRSILVGEAVIEGDVARKALTIATRTMPYLSKGLRPESAAAAVKVIHEVTGLTAVAITDTERILAHVGLASDHHLAGVPLRTNITREALQHNAIITAKGRMEIDCEDGTCPLQGVVVTPLRENERPIGTLKLYFDPARSRPPLELAEGLAFHFSTQLAMARASEQAALLDKAEIRALQAQIQPHFLFNALNTVMALIRLDPDMARDVLGHLADYLRRNLKATQVETVTLREELEHVRNYLSVEQARHGNRLSVTYDVPLEALSALIPPLTLQPLVENAVVHGLRAVKEDGLIQLSGTIDNGVAVVSVADNGSGIDPVRLEELLTRPAVPQGGAGLALYNVNQRLKGLFGQSAGLHIDSQVGIGTTVTLKLPLPARREEENHVDSGAGRG